MVPFHSFVDSLLEGAERAGSFSSMQKAYFHDVPEILFSDPFLSQPLQSPSFDLREEMPKLLIFSDAGAARGKTEASRIELTLQLMDKLLKRHERIVWLNPMPRHRWKDSSAEQIAAQIPMFECNPLGINMAVDRLRGHYANERRGA